MINFFPSRRVQKDTGLDFDLLSRIFSEIFNRGFEKNLFFRCQVHKSRDDKTSTLEKLEEFTEPFYKINLDIDGNRRYIISSILHELRHAFQQTIFEYDVVARFSSYRAYYNSTEEKDARKQEKLTSEIIKIYDNYQKAQEKFERFDLKELG
tara:strand:+ start:211 stop:666 length:456 start_codon:yes stop_codon:yes gene_type:complete